MKIYVNNSSIPRLRCGYQFVFQNVLGLRTPTSEFLAYGTAFHHWMRVIEPGDSAMSLIALKPAPHQCLELMQMETVAQCAGRAVHTFSLLAPVPHSRETYFEFDTTRLILNRDWLDADDIVVDAGTIDRTEVVQIGGQEYVGLTDYKTTFYKLDRTKLFVKYALSGQMKFYASRLRYAARAGLLSGTPFEPVKHLLEAGFIARRYAFVSKANEPDEKAVLVQPFEPIHERELDTYDGMIASSRDMFVYYAKNPQMAMKTGQLNDVCGECAFNQICLSPNEAVEKQQIETWAHGMAPFNPKHDEP